MSSDILEQLLDDFELELDRGWNRALQLPRRARRQRILRMSLPAAAACAAVVTAVVLTTGGVDSKTFLAQAEAALSADGKVVHLVIDTQLARGGASQTITTEQWTTTKPSRWRLRETVALTAGQRGVQEFSWANGVQDAYSSRSDRLSVRRGFSLDGPAARIPSTVFLTDPIAQLRELLARHLLRDAGTTVRYGHRVRRLVGRESSRLSARSATFYVDAHTFAPLGGTIRSRFGQTTSAARFRVRVYERLPMKAAGRAALEIPIRPTTTVIVRSTPTGKPRLLGRGDPCHPRVELGPARCAGD